MNEELEQTKKKIVEAEKRDRVGFVGEVVAVGTGATVAVVNTTAIASALGVASIVPAKLLGSAWLAGATGLATSAAIVTTPVGWTIAIAVGISAATYGLAKLIHSGGFNSPDARKKIG